MDVFVFAMFRSVVVSSLFGLLECLKLFGIGCLLKQLPPLSSIVGKIDTVNLDRLQSILFYYSLVCVFHFKK